MKVNANMLNTFLSSWENRANTEKGDKKFQQDHLLKIW